MTLHITTGWRPDCAWVTRATLRRQCREGRLPAEALDTADRAYLVHQLWELGWTDAEIATHTWMTTYTTARIRTRLKLAPHRPVEGAA